MLMKTDVGWGQGCHNCNPNIGPDNSDVRMDNYPIPIDGNGQLSFQEGYVTDWHSAYNTPHHVQLINDECIEWYEFANGTELNCLAARQRDNYTEGIFHQLDLAITDPSDIFTLTLDISRLLCSDFNASSFVNIKFARNLIPFPNNGGIEPPPTVPHHLFSKVLVENNDVYSVCESFSFPNQQQVYNQIYIHTENTSQGQLTAFINVDNVLLSCRSTALVGINEVINNLAVSFEADWNSIYQDIVTYSWSFGDGNTSTLATPNHNYNQDGYYEVCLTVTNNNGCCATFCKEITVGCPVPEADFNIQQENCGIYTLIPAVLRPNTTYTWAAPNGNPASGTGTSFTTTYLNNGSYTITLTATNQCGTSSSTQTVVMNCEASCDNLVRCISIGDDINSITLLSNLISGQNPIIPNSPYLSGIKIENLCFSVKGTLIVDVLQVNFIKTHWFMEPGSSIRVRPAGIWGPSSFVNSRLQGCTQMWRGIVVEANTNFPSGIILTNTTIQDAWRAVELGNKTVLAANRCNFYNNYTGIYTTTTSGQNEIHTEISNTKFEDTDNMLPAYAGQPDYSLRSYAGIVANRVIPMIIGNGAGKNTFKNLLYGIRSHNSSLFINNNEFIDTYWNGSTSGILVDSTGPITKIEGDNFFKDISTDIYINGDGGVPSNISIKGNNESIRRKPYTGETRRSIHIINNISSTVTIEDYYIFGNDLGIRLEGEFKNLKVENNEFTVEGPNARFLDINTMNNSENTSSISHNNILFDLSGSYGNNPLFKISDCSYLSVINNVIHNNTGVIVSGQSTAFDVRGTDKSLFKENKVYWPGRGFELWGSDDGEVNGYCCNTAKEVPTSSSNFNFRFFSNHGKSFFRQNRLNRLNLYADADIGPQENAGNLWEGQNTLASISNGTDEDADDNRFVTDYLVPGARPMSYSPSNWFRDNGTFPTCENNPDCGIPPFSFQHDDDDLTDDGPDAQDPPIIIVDPARPTCEALKDLYKRLEGIDSIASPVSYWSVISLINKWKIWKGASWIEACLDSVVTFNPDITPWYDAEKEKDGVYKATESQRQLMAPYMSDMLALTEDISQIQLDSTMTLTPAQVQLYQDLYTAHSLYTSGVNVFKQSMVDRANNLLPDLIALPTPLPFLADKKKVWIAEMKIVVGGISALDSIEWNEIRDIALKCPNEFGQAVFEAQTLMRNIGEEYSSDPECLPSTPRSKNNLVIAQDILVSPNPGSGQFDFLWFKDVQIDAISIFDITGRLIIKKDIRSDQNQISIDITNQVPGVYIWESKSGSEVKQKGKIIKI